MHKSAFKSSAQPVAVTIAGQTVTAEPKAFSTGSVGFFLNGKITVNVNGQLVRLQVSGNLTAIGSKEWPE
jgi:hypothetical protein